MCGHRPGEARGSWGPAANQPRGARGRFVLIYNEGAGPDLCFPLTGPQTCSRCWIVHPSKVKWRENEGRAMSLVKKLSGILVLSGRLSNSVSYGPLFFEICPYIAFILWNDSSQYVVFFVVLNVVPEQNTKLTTLSLPSSFWRGPRGNLFKFIEFRSQKTASLGDFEIE